MQNKIEPLFFPYSADHAGIIEMLDCFCERQSFKSYRSNYSWSIFQHNAFHF